MIQITDGNVYQLETLCPACPDVTILTIAAIFLAGVFLAGLDTASNSLVVAMLGPQRAPPFTQVNRKYCIIIFIIIITA